MATYLVPQTAEHLCPPPQIRDSPSYEERTAITWLGIGTYTVLIVLAIVYYLERTAFVDISFHLFSLITSGTWAIQNFRFGALFTQAVPLLGIHMGLSLHSLALLYSLVFLILYASIFWIVVRVLRQPRLGLLLLGYHVVMVTDTFYWIQSELSQGVAFLILYFAVLFRIDQDPMERSKPVWSMVHPVVLFMLVFFHPLMLFVFGFLWIYFWHTRALDRRLLGISGGAFGSMYLIKHLFFKTPYDTQSMEGMGNLVRFFPHYDEVPTMIAFAGDLVHDYTLMLGGLFILLIWAVAWRKWMILVMVFGSFVGYTLLVNCSYPDDTVKFYRENLHLPLAIFVLTPLILQVLPARPPRAAWLGIGVICLIRLVHIQQAHEPYTARLDWMRQFLQDHPGQKLIVDDRLLPADTLLMTWASPYEFWLLSTLETGQTASVLLTDQPQEFVWAAGMPDQFIAKWGVFPYDHLPGQYFQFRNNVPYQVIGDVQPGR